MRITTSFLFALVPLLFAGCAWYDIHPVSPRDLEGWPKGKPTAAEGYIIYQPELYFSATVQTEVVMDANGKGQTNETVTVAPLYLPNYRKPYRLTTHNFLAKADFAFDLENGWKLTKLSDKSDNSTVANTLAGQLQTMLAAAGLKNAVGVPAKTRQRVILYHPEFDPDTGVFSRFTQVNVTELLP